MDQQPQERNGDGISYLDKCARLTGVSVYKPVEICYPISMEKDFHCLKQALGHWWYNGCFSWNCKWRWCSIFPFWVCLVIHCSWVPIWLCWSISPSLHWMGNVAWEVPWLKTLICESLFPYGTYKSILGQWLFYHISWNLGAPLEVSKNLQAENKQWQMWCHSSSEIWGSVNNGGLFIP